MKKLFKYKISKAFGKSKFKSLSLDNGVSDMWGIRDWK